MTIVMEIMQATEAKRSRSKHPPMRSLCKVVAPAAVVTAMLAGGAGCTASGEDVAPDRFDIFFPTGAVVSPDGKNLFVVNSNSDLKYSSGAISVLPLPFVDEVIAEWQKSPPTIRDPGECQPDLDFSEMLVCNEQLFLGATGDRGVRIGNFGTDIALQDLSNGDLRLLVPTRGDPSIAWADWSAVDSRLSCDDSSDPFGACDNKHRLSFAFNSDDNAAIPEEPFGVFADSAGQFAMITHLTTGSVTLIDSPRDAGACPDEQAPDARCVQVTDIQKDIFEPDPLTGLRGATGIAGRGPGGIVYVGSRSEDRIQTFTVGRLTPPREPMPDEPLYKPPFLLQGSWFMLDGVGNGSTTNSSASDTRGMAFSPSGDRLYLLNRKPPALQILDTSIGPTGVPNNQLVGAVDICRQASTVTVVDSGDGERAYLTCFQDGQIYVVDPRGRGRVEEVITVGQGPYSAAAAPMGQRLYVTNFLEDTIAVIDLKPGSPTRNRVVLRIGKPRTL
jgi:DNA-binding beta-propeller fold protein YncE